MGVKHLQKSMVSTAPSMIKSQPEDLGFTRKDEPIMTKIEPYSSKEIFVDKHKIMSKYKENESDRRKLTQFEARQLKEMREKKLQQLK